MKSVRILILEDRGADVELMLYELRQAGYQPQWMWVNNEADFLRSLRQRWDVILADYFLPQFDARHALHLLRQRGLDIPLLLVSGAIGEDVAAGAMRDGALDFVHKDRLGGLGPAVDRALKEKRRRRARRRAKGPERSGKLRTRTAGEKDREGDEAALPGESSVRAALGSPSEVICSREPDSVLERRERPPERWGKPRKSG